MPEAISDHPEVLCGLILYTRQRVPHRRSEAWHNRSDPTRYAARTSPRIDRRQRQSGRLCDSPRNKSMAVWAHDECGMDGREWQCLLYDCCVSIVMVIARSHAGATFSAGIAMADALPRRFPIALFKSGGLHLADCVWSIG